MYNRVRNTSEIKHVGQGSIKSEGDFGFFYWWSALFSLVFIAKDGS